LIERRREGAIAEAPAQSIRGARVDARVNSAIGGAGAKG